MKKKTLFDAHPFLLQGHLRCSRGERLQQLIGDGCEIVEDSTGTDEVIVRAGNHVDNPFPYRLASATSPTGVERAESWGSADGVKKIISSNDVAQLRSMAHWSLGRLATLAREGNSKALWHFADDVCESVEALSQMMAANPEALAPLARGRIRWPMMRSTHPLNCDPDKFLADVQLGADVPLQLDKYSKWKPGFAAQHAVDLFNHIEHLRGDGVNIWIVEKRKRTHFKDFLPPFTKDTAQTWWNVAEKFLLHTYPHPEKIPELAKIVTAPTKRKSPGRIKQAVLDKIKARFLALAK